MGSSLKYRQEKYLHHVQTFPGGVLYSKLYFSFFFSSWISSK